MAVQTIKAIVVDDEDNARNLVPIIVDWHSLGYEFVGEATSGSEALELIEAVRPDVVFTDINMPFMDGLELSRLIKIRHPLVKIVIITAHPEFEYAKKSLQIGVQSFILKPLEAEEVERVALEIKQNLHEEATRWNEYQQLQEQLKENAVH
ncbi:response regulator [Cohnella suwonensis]|uniref:Response regulator n=1 Tax=Cohnella suwonensis TaxID=696072 RepID=A0ABW0LW61_9BACL